jgi:hypothetical protein
LLRGAITRTYARSLCRTLHFARFSGILRRSVSAAKGGLNDLVLSLVRLGLDFWWISPYVYVTISLAPNIGTEQNED